MPLLHGLHPGLPAAVRRDLLGAAPLVPPVSLRLREHAGSVAFEYLAGGAWTCLCQTPTPAWLAASRLELGLVAYQAESLGCQGELEDVAEEPSACPGSVGCR